MQLRAYAKVNLGLDVVGRRPDGYHDIRTVMQTIGMYDVLNMKISREPGIHLTCNLPYVPCDERNLVFRAAKLLMDEFDIRHGVDVELRKVIPICAGMAGGSSDAAAALVGVNRLFGLHLTKADLMKRGVAIGADVPYCVMRGTALAEGIGEILTPLPALPPCYILVGKPPVSVSTRDAYKNLRLEEQEHPHINGLVKAIRRRDLEGVFAGMGNIFEPGIIRQYPVIREIKELMLRHGARNALMSGSGPTVFGIFDDEGKWKEATHALWESGLAKTVFATKPFGTEKRRKKESAV